jgi:hypothetical protein
MIRSILIPDEFEKEYAEDVVARGQAAHRLLSDSTLAFAMREAERDALLQWQVAETTEERERIHAELMYADRLVRMLVAMVSDADVIQHIREEQEAEGPS